MKKIPRQRPRDNGNGLVVGCAKPLVEQPIILLTIPSLAGPAKLIDSITKWMSKRLFGWCTNAGLWVPADHQLKS